MRSLTEPCSESGAVKQASRRSRSSSRGTRAMPRQSSREALSRSKRETTSPSCSRSKRTPFHEKVSSHSGARLFLTTDDRRLLAARSRTAYGSEVPPRSAALSPSADSSVTVTCPRSSRSLAVARASARARGWKEREARQGRAAEAAVSAASASAVALPGSGTPRQQGEEEEEEGGRCHRHCSGTPVLVRSNSSTSCCSWRPVALAASSEGATSRTSASQTAKARQKCARARGGPWPSFQLRMSRRRVAISASLRCCRAASAPVEPCASPLAARSSVGSRSEAISPARWCSIEWYFSSLCDERATCASRASSCSASVSTASASSAGATKERASARRRVEARPQRSLTARQPDSGGVAAARWPERETQSAASSAR
mmetsp:Transcript_2329/g.7614  ORF Transcript_2329/g.7614 Transcript_2329/m.7614 type:complete len:374 (-) Transcript_2329:296-1417(-)